MSRAQRGTAKRKSTRSDRAPWLRACPWMSPEGGCSAGSWRGQDPRRAILTVSRARQCARFYLIRCLGGGRLALNLLGVPRSHGIERSLPTSTLGIVTSRVRPAGLSGAVLMTLALFSLQTAVHHRSTETVAPPRSDSFPSAVYALQTRMSMGAYVAEIWVDVGPTAKPFHGILLLSRDGAVVLREEDVVALGKLSGQDITGEGDPDLIVERYSGGAHCCGGTYVLSLGAEVRRIDIPCPPRGNVSRLSPDPLIPWGFHDLDDDGVFEFVTWDDSFAYLFGSYVGSPAVPVVLQYASDRGYVPANHFLLESYEVAILEQKAWMKSSSLFSRDREVTRSAVAQLALLYLYSGRADEAWKVLCDHYPYPDAGGLRVLLEAIAERSPCFRFCENCAR